MAVSMAMAIIDTEDIDIMAEDTIIEGIMVDIMGVAEDTMATDIEGDMREAPIEAADTIVEVAEDTVGPVVVDIPEAEAIEVVATAEVVEIIEVVAVVAAEAVGLAEVTVVVVAEAVDTLPQA